MSTDLSEQLLTRDQVLQLTGCSYPALWAWMRKDQFPRSRVVGSGVRWLRSEVEKWLADLQPRKLKGDDDKVEA